MRQIMDQNGGCGLAANQVGLDLSLLIYSWDGDINVMLNPNLNNFRYKYKNKEGCLSLPDKNYMVDRYSSIEATWLDIDLIKNNDHFHGMESIIIQHETDHLNGITLENKPNALLLTQGRIL